MVLNNTPINNFVHLDIFDDDLFKQYFSKLFAKIIKMDQFKFKPP